MKNISQLGFHWEGEVQEIRHKQEAIHSLNLLQLFLFLTVLSAFFREKEKTTFSSRHLKPWVLTRMEKTYNKLILFNTHNKCLGLYGNLTYTLWCRICKGWLLQVYDENMRLGKTTYSKVNKLQMRLPYHRIYSNTVSNNNKKNKISLHKYSFSKQKSYFGCTLSDLCGVLTSQVNNLK